MVRIVICDDEIHIRKGLQRAVELMDSQFQVVGTAGNGDEACRMIAQTKPDLVLMDINMPGINGLDVISRLSGTFPDLRYIIISGYDEFDYARKALRLGVADYLLKPIDKQELYDLIKKLTARDLTVQPSEMIPLAERIRIYIEANFQDPELSLAVLAKQFHVSESYLTRVIKKECQKSYTEFLNMLRLEAAKRILESDSEIQSQQVAARTGYINKHYFCRVFKQYTGYSPIEYQKRHFQKGSLQ